MTTTATLLMPTGFGTFTVRHHRVDGADLLSLVHGDVTTGVPIVRLQSACLLGQTFGSRQCDCKEQLEGAMCSIQKAAGVIVFSPNGEGRGAGLAAKVRLLELEQTTGCDSDEAYLLLGYKTSDLRDFTSEARVLLDIGVSKTIHLLTANERKRRAVRNAGFRL